MQGGWTRRHFSRVSEAIPISRSSAIMKMMGFAKGSTHPSYGLSQLAHVNVDVEIDPAHALLRRLVRAALVRLTTACSGVSDVGEFQTPPLWQLAAALSGELPRQHGFLAIPV